MHPDDHMDRRRLKRAASCSIRDCDYGASVVDLRAFVAVALLVAGFVAACASAAPYGAATRRCVPPLGPGDTMRHSVNLRVANIGCNTGRLVALACARFSYGSSGSCLAVGYRWRCTSSKLSGLASAEKCLSGRRSMSIVWTD
jgi:hypothetical protein